MLNKAPSVWGLRNLIEHSNGGSKAGIKDESGETAWVPARPLGYGGLKSRLSIAWGVFKGKYDALEWPGGQ